MRTLVLLLTACNFSASTTVLSEDSGEAVDPSVGDSATTGGEDSGASSEPVDLDGDGYTEAEGDCDDEDPDVAPGLPDDCDGVDTDCDGQIDEEAVDSDGYEPNDVEGWSLGTLSDGDSYTLEAALHDDDDVDRFELSIDDRGTNLFELVVELSGIPDGAIYELELIGIDDDESVYSDSGSEGLSTVFDDASFSDETGTYRIQVRSLGGADCAHPYTVQIDYEEWGW